MWFKGLQDRIGTTRDAALQASRLPSRFTAARRVVPPTSETPARAGVFVGGLELVERDPRRAIQVQQPSEIQACARDTPGCCCIAESGRLPARRRIRWQTNRD